MQPPSGISPRMPRSTPLRTSPVITKDSTRDLPPKDVTAETVTDAYVAFILYCNPQFALDIDTTALRTTFNSPPRSDNKEFQTFRLFELIRKLDSKEIKTWGQLALDLGVEAPDVSKGQSVQKVQQYSVRLKRWMRAMHIDAFFEYLLGKQHVYFTEVPPASDPYPTGGRDGVSSEEDLAIRALDPSFRPKRGRRRNSETEQDEDADTEVPSKQARNSEGPNSSAIPLTATPYTAHPGGYHDPWTAASAITPQSLALWGNRGAPQSAIVSTAPSPLRWQLQGGPQTASTPHPMTSQSTSMAAHIDAAFDVEPKSAITPSGRKRRKHGPAVSSAWPSANASGAKPRGRPPASRQTQDGPFNTFPVDPANEKSSNASKIAASDLHPSGEADPGSHVAPPLLTRNSDGSSRPGRLSLQVPQHTGGPVRLATPPRVLLNGETNSSEGHSDSQTPVLPAAQMSIENQRRIKVVGNIVMQEREVPGFAYEALKRTLTSDLLRAELIGRRHRLSGDEAKSLAEAVLDRLGVPRKDTEESRDDVTRITAASWLGLGEQLNVPLGPATSQGKRIFVTRFRRDAEGYEEIVSAHDGSPGEVREVFDIAWVVALNGCNGTFELKGLSLATSVQEEEDSHDMMLRKCIAAAKKVGNDGDRSLQQQFQQVAASHRMRPDEDGVDWRSKYMAMEFGSRMARGELQRLRNRMIEMVLDAALQA